MAAQKRPAKSPESATAKRTYTLRLRGSAMAETRARIVDAALEFYETVGPAGTTMSGVAQRASVTRATLYRHFPSDEVLANSVIDEWATGNPAIDVAALAEITDLPTRIRAALGRLYGGYRATEALTGHLLHDAHVLPAGRRAALRESARQVRDVVGGAAGKGVVTRDAPFADAALGHAVAFETWRSLSDEGLDDLAIVDLMAGLISSAGSAGRTARPGRPATPADDESATPQPSVQKASLKPRADKSGADKSKAGKGKGKGADKARDADKSKVADRTRGAGSRGGKKAKSGRGGRSATSGGA